jgi:hypothetical protein
MDGDREWLNHRCFTPTQAIGYPQAIDHRGNYIFGKTAVDMGVATGRTIVSHVAAEVITAAATELAHTARDRRINSHPLTKH